MDTPPDLQEPIASVLGRTPSGLFILTAANNTGQETGLLASWVQQISFDPPMVTVAINAKRYVNAWLEERPVLGLSIIAEEQKFFLKHYGAGFAPDESAFAGIAVTRSPTGLPMLSASLGWMEGAVRNKWPVGDHVLYSVEVTGAHRGPHFHEWQPYVHIRKNGFRY